MGSHPTRTQIDRLGDRLRRGAISENDLRLLDTIRRSYSPSYETVIAKIRAELRLEPTGRPAKSTSAIIEKLQRESIRLSQMQDIAGCRIIVPDAASQESAMADLARILPEVFVVDRRARPSHGYRAVHVVANVSDRPIEIQLRTALQHAWAELSEKYADVFDPSIKYGGGSPEMRESLHLWSNMITTVEGMELAPGETPPEELAQITRSMRKIMEDLIGDLEGTAGNR